MIHSRKFSTGAKFEDSWFLELKIKRDVESSKNKSCLSIYLISSNGSRRVRTKYLLFILNNKKESIVSGNAVHNE